jgi:hypothetical protein
MKNPIPDIKDNGCKTTPELLAGNSIAAGGYVDIIFDDIVPKITPENQNFFFLGLFIYNDNLVMRSARHYDPAKSRFEVVDDPDYEQE